MTTIQKFLMTEILFVGEQDGIPERAFKRRAIPILHSYDVSSAYLARLRYPGESDTSVALCIRNAHEEKELVDRLVALFASMFRRDEHLDIMILDDEREQDLKRVCPPFFSKDRK